MLFQKIEDVLTGLRKREDVSFVETIMLNKIGVQFIVEWCLTKGILPDLFLFKVH